MMSISDCFLKMRENVEKIIAQRPYEEIEKIKEKCKETENKKGI